MQNQRRLAATLVIMAAAGACSLVDSLRLLARKIFCRSGMDGHTRASRSDTRPLRRVFRSYVRKLLVGALVVR